MDTISTTTLRGIIVLVYTKAAGKTKPTKLTQKTRENPSQFLGVSMQFFLDYTKHFQSALLTNSLPLIGSKFGNGCKFGIMYLFRQSIVPLKL